MVDVAQIRMFGKTVGTVSWDAQYGVARFEYDADFVKCGIQPSPILMPAREGRVYSFGNLNWDTFKGLPGMLADSLPDTYGRALFDKWLAYQRLPHTTPKENNFLYLLDIYALSKCQYLIGGVNGCVLMALNLNGNRYRDVDILNTGVN